MSAHTTRLANSKRAMDIYNARNAYYKLLRLFPDLRGTITRVTFQVSSPDPLLAHLAFECDEGYVFVMPNEKKVHINLVETGLIV